MRVGYKKVSSHEGYAVAKLEILGIVRGRGSACSDDRKRRTSRARVLWIRKIRHDSFRLLKKKLKLALSSRDSSFAYSPGQIVVPFYPFDTSSEHCASGVHFFWKLSDAIRY